MLITSTSRESAAAAEGGRADRLLEARFRGETALVLLESDGVTGSDKL